MLKFHDLNQREVSHTLLFTLAARHDKQQQTKIKKKKSLPTLLFSAWLPRSVVYYRCAGQNEHHAARKLPNECITF